MFHFKPISSGFLPLGATSSNQPVIQSVPPNRRLPNEEDLKFFEEFEFFLNGSSNFPFPRLEEVEPFFQQVHVPEDRLAALLRTCCGWDLSTASYFLPLLQSNPKLASSDAIMNWITIIQKDFEVYKEDAKDDMEENETSAVDKLMGTLVKQKSIHPSSMSSISYLDILLLLVKGKDLDNSYATGIKSFLDLAKEFQLNTRTCKEKIDTIVQEDSDIEIQLRLIECLPSCTQTTKDKVFDRLHHSILKKPLERSDLRRAYFSKAVEITSAPFAAKMKEKFQTALEKLGEGNERNSLQWCMDEIQKNLDKRKLERHEESKQQIIKA